MILSSCHDYSLNNDRHCHCHYMQRIYVYFILPCLALPCLGETLYELVIHYHIILYLRFFYFISSADLISIPFYSILFYFISNWFDLIWFYSTLFYWIWFTILFSIVSHSNEWFVSICPSIRPSVCLSFWFSVCLYE